MGSIKPNVSTNWIALSSEYRLGLFANDEIVINAGTTNGTPNLIDVQRGRINARDGIRCQSSPLGGGTAADIGESGGPFRNVYAQSFIESSHVPNMKNKERALDKLKNIHDWAVDGKVNHKAHYACIENEDDAEEVHTGISLGKRCAEMEKMIWELNQEIEALKNGSRK